MSDRPEDIGPNADAIVDDRLDELGRGLGLETLRRLMQKTPVDTGRAKANWNVSRGSPDLTTTTHTDERRALRKGQLTVGFFRLSKEDLWLANGLPYIERLEYGWSKQAPLGMARLTVSELEPLARRIGARLNVG